MAGTASVLLTPQVLAYLMAERAEEIAILHASDFGDGLIQVCIEHARLRPGYNGQTELFFTPWPHGEIRFRREADT